MSVRVGRDVSALVDESGTQPGRTDIDYKNGHARVLKSCHLRRVLHVGSISLDDAAEQRTDH
jgi:hypothetical protein